MKSLKEKIKEHPIHWLLIGLSLLSAVLNAVTGDWMLMIWQLMTTWWIYMYCRADHFITELLKSNKKSLDLCEEMIKAMEFVNNNASKLATEVDNVIKEIKVPRA